MQFHVFARKCVLLLLVLASSSLVLAQFQKPTDEELKMTADPKAPGAAAVYLNIEEIANDPAHYQSVYARIKVLTEKGKELATVEIPYLHGDFKVTNIKARTIHSDGTVIPLTGKPEDLLIVKTKSKDGDPLQANRKVLTLPSVEVGSILEYSYDIHYDSDIVSSPTWEVQRPYFVHKARYAFTPFKAFLPGFENRTSMFVTDKDHRALTYLLSWSILPKDAKINVDVTGRYVLEMTDIPAIPNEEWMPPSNGTFYHVVFYYMASSGANYWIDEAKRWSKDVNHFAEPSKSISEAVAGLVAPGDSGLDKAKKLYKAVQALDNTDFSRKITESERKLLNLKEPKRAEDTWAQKSGSSKDISLLYLAMLRAAGLTAHDMAVVDRSQRVFDLGYLNMDQFEDNVVDLVIDGKEIFLDPGEKMCPFQTLNWKHSGARGLLQGDSANAISSTPVQFYLDNKVVRKGDVSLDEHGAITGLLQLSMTGQRALYWRQKALENDSEELKKQFDHSLEALVPDGVNAHVSSFWGLENPDVNLIAFVKISGTLGVATSKRLLLPGFFFETRGSHPFVSQEKRLEPVDMQYADTVSDQITYHLPAGFSVEGAPQETKIPWEGHANFHSKSVTGPGTITIARVLMRGFAIAKPEEYQDLRGFYQKIAAADQAQLVLTKTAPSTKGN